MSNEELAIRVKNGDADAILPLWNAVNRFIAAMAKKYSFANEKAAETEDLINSGYFAVCEAAKAFEPERGTAFLTLLGYYLKKAFAEASGTRSTKRDALMYCESLNGPAFWLDSDSGEQLEYIEDDTSESPFIAIEQQDFLQYTRSVIAAAMETLEPKQKAVLTEKYLKNKTWQYCAEKCKYADKRTAWEAAERALSRLARGKYSRQLRECLDEFNDYNEYKQASHSNGISSFYRYGVSSIEAVALLKEGGFENDQ